MLLQAHSGVRYLVLLLGVITLLYALTGVVSGKPYTKAMKGLASAYAGSLHLQILLGFAVVFSGRFYSALFGHIFMLLAAAAVAQVVPTVMRRRPEDQRTYMPHLIGTVVSLVLIVGGIMAIGRPILGTLIES